MPLITIALLAALFVPDGEAPAGPALTIRLVRPQVQGQQFLALFEGAPMPHPAAALAAYKRALMGNTGLNKAVEGGIAALNPDMLAELATLDNATFRFAPAADGRLAWSVVVPRDDGTFSAYATAAALTDGASMPSLEGVAVDRLGPRPGASLAARAPGGFLLAGTRDELANALRRSREPLPPPSIVSGLLARFAPSGLDAPGQPIELRRLGAACVGVGCKGFDSSITLQGETLTATVIGHYAAPMAPGLRPIPKRWLDGVPSGSTLAAFAVALDPSPKAWDAAFAVFDRIEKADPAFVAVAPLRTRIDVLAAAAGVRTDADLLGLLVGISVIVTVDDTGTVDGALVRLHAKDEPAAERLRTATIPRLAETMRLRVTETRAGNRIEVSGSSILVERKGDTVLLAWGPTIAERVAEAEAKPDRVWLDGSGFNEHTQRFAAVWPGRLSKGNLATIPPATWVGRFDGNTSVDRVDWPGLKTVVRRMLEGLPFDPPPDAATPLNGRKD
jgi:hypothetical protein